MIVGEVRAEPDPGVPPERAALLWQPEGVAVSASLSQAVIAELCARLAAGRAEFGGILMGRVEQPAEGVYRTIIEGYEDFPLDERDDAPYVLSPSDRKRLAQRLDRLRRRRGPEPVGFWRSHQRRGLYLDQRDFDLFRDFFDHPSAVFLLVRPEESGQARGGFFVWEEEDMRRHASYLEFPLGVAVPAPAMPSPAPAAAKPPAPRPLAAPRPAPAPPRPAVLPPMAALRHAPTATRPSPQTTRIIIPRAALRTAAMALVTLILPLLSFYTARYVAARRRITPAVSIRNSAAVESPVAAPAPQPSAPAPSPSEAPQFDARPDTSPAPQPPHRNTADRVDAVKGTPAAPKKETETALVLPEPPPVAPPTAGEAPHIPAPAAAPPPRPQKKPEDVVAYVKPSERSSLFQRMPILRSLTRHSGGQAYIPPNPIQHPLPALPDRMPKRVDDTTVELVARIDERGGVKQVRVVNGDRQLARAAEHALLRWRFDPARRDNEPVESEMLIRFEFRKP